MQTKYPPVCARQVCNSFRSASINTGPHIQNVTRSCKTSAEKLTTGKELSVCLYEETGSAATSSSQIDGSGEVENSRL
jgi:hypothetical protein